MKVTENFFREKYTKSGATMFTLVEAYCDLKRIEADKESDPFELELSKALLFDIVFQCERHLGIKRDVSKDIPAIIQQEAKPHRTMQEIQRAVANRIPQGCSFVLLRNVFYALQLHRMANSRQSFAFMSPPKRFVAILTHSGGTEVLQVVVK